MRSLLTLLALLLFSASVSLPQATLHAEATPGDSKPPTEAPALAAISDQQPLIEVTAAAIEKVKQQAIGSEQLSEEARAEVIDLCDKAAARRLETQTLATNTTTLRTEVDESGRAFEELQAQVARAVVEPAAFSALTADELRAALTAADARVSAAREKLQKTTGEIERRANRRKTLPEELAKCREQASSADEALKQPTPTDGPLLAEARRFFQSTRRDYFRSNLQWLEQENRTYEATARLWLARRDAFEKQLEAAGLEHSAIHALVAEAQRKDAELQARQARRTAINAHPAVKEAAAKNAELAESNRDLVRETQQTQALLTEARDLGQIMQTRFDDVKLRSEAAKNSPAIGVMLRSQRDQLPDLAAYRRRLRSRPIAISQLGLDIYEWESLRSESLHIDHAIDAAKDQIEPAADPSTRDEIIAELRRVLEARPGILVELNSNANDHLSRLKELDAAESKLVDTTEKLASFIAEQVLWVRSAPTISGADLKYAKSFLGEIDGRTQQGRLLTAAIMADARRQPFWWGLAIFLAVGLVFSRRRVRSILRARGEIAARTTATLFRPTVDATLATILLAAPTPLICGFLGWRLSQFEDVLCHAAGWALTLFAAAYAMLNLARHASRPGGLGTNHFGWDPKGLAAIRHAARSVELLALPLLAVAVGLEVARDEASINALGRLSLVASLLVIGVVSLRLFRPHGSLGTALANSEENSWGARSFRLLAPIATILVLGLIAATAAGYHYTAMQLTRRVFVTCLFVFACLALRSLLMRWLLVSYRRVAMQRARERRQALLEAKENAAENPTVEVEPQVSLVDINQQARKLVGVGAGLAFVMSMWFVWGDVLPALGIFSRVELWTSGIASGDPTVGPVFVTLADLLIAASAFALTWFAGRNLPGLLEIAVLQRLPLDAGARYAATSVTRYLILVVGAALGMHQLGIGWQSVQWLVAAMTVGLGFGLQEIFANFVSGIILLFERPARVGDTVTIGAITGTVTKIRIRATTILDWDNKELIVPNKEFVTGNLVNWTLTNPNLRLTVNVGIAYGSDTRLATSLLYRVAEESPHVMEYPDPVVIFTEFGESSLNFELRTFVSDLSTYRRLKHDLHLAIDDLFRQHHIEIAFPQCDLHVRSLPKQIMARRGESLASRLEQIAEEAA